MISPLAAIRELANIPAYHKQLASKGTSTHWERLTYGNHKRQYVLFAEQDDPHAPVAVWIHGGGWQFGDPEKLVAFGEYFFKRGYTVYMPSHRRIPRHDGDAIFTDVCKALAMIQKRAFSPPQILLGGMSSGGQLAALLALRQNEWRTSANLLGLITSGSPLSLRHMGASPTRRWFAGSPKKERFDTLDPYAQLKIKPDFPAVILHGTKDGLVPWKSAVAFVNQARHVGWDELNFVSLPGGSHLDAATFIRD